MAEPVLLGLLGGIGSGKSTVARCLAEAGAEVLDADRMAHDCLERPEVRDAVARRFGNLVLDPTRRVDRARLATIAFADDAARRDLEAIVHPCVLERLQARIAATRGAPRRAPAPPAPAAEPGGGRRVLVLDVPLLLETGLDSLCDALLFVDAPLATRLERVRRDRGWDEAELQRREKIQKAIEHKRSVADYTIVNAGPLDDVRARARAIVAELVGDARHRSGSQAGPTPRNRS